MFTLYERVGVMLKQAGMSSKEIKAGCAKCGACSALSILKSKPPMSTKSYQFKLATDAQEIAAYFALRCSIFAEEQQLFQGNDVDEIDLVAYPIVALATDTNQVVGVVRIYEVESGIWYGGRLGTHRDYRKGWQIGKGLIYKAVTTANAWGAIAS
jgi:ribosomal protein S12